MSSDPVRTKPERRLKHAVTHAEAARILADRDPALAGLIARAGLIRISLDLVALRRAGSGDLYQQLAGAAAKSIHSWLIAALEGDVTPEAILALPDERLRAVGSSANKALSLRDLALKVLDGRVALSPRALSR